MFERSLGLDFVRATAILLVLFAHSGFGTIAGINPGWVGVEIFFVLSGYLIGQILIKEFFSGITIQKLFRFWIRRWMRTLPMYYLVILIKFIFIDHSLGYKILVYFFFLQNNFVGVSFYPVTWSLVIEEWFYLILPLALILFFRAGISAKAKQFFIFCIVFILFINAARLLWVLYTDRPWGAIVGNFPFRLDSLLVGVLIAGIKKLFPEKFSDVLLNKYVFITGVISAFIILALFGISNENRISEHLWTRTALFFLLSFFISLTIPFLDKYFIVKENLFSKFITWISLISYSLYLVHPLVFKYSPQINNLTVDIIFKNIMCILICSATYKFFEKPVMDLREKIKI